MDDFTEGRRLPERVESALLQLVGAMTSVAPEHCLAYADLLDAQAAQLLDRAPAGLDGTRWTAVLAARTAEVLRAVAEVGVRS